MQTYLLRLVFSPDDVRQEEFRANTVGAAIHCARMKYGKRLKVVALLGLT